VPGSHLTASKVITASEIQRFAVAIGAMHAQYHDVSAANALGHRNLVAPPFFFATVGLSAGRVMPSSMLRSDGMPRTDDLPGRVVAGETSVNWFGPILAGDELRFEQRIINRFTKHGRSGALDFCVYQRTYSTADRLVVTEKLTRISREEAPAVPEAVTHSVGEANPAEALPGVCGTEILQTKVKFRELDLFMFSAASWLTARIHFDRDYARSEGYPDIVVHGPLQGAYLSQLLVDMAAPFGGDLTSLAYRHHRPALCSDTLTFYGFANRPVERDGAAHVDMDLRITRSDGAIVTSGRGTLRFAESEEAAEEIVRRLEAIKSKPTASVSGND